MLHPENMCPSAFKLRKIYAMTPGAPLFKREFGYYCLERWYNEGLPMDADFNTFFNYDAPGNFSLTGLGFCEASFYPAFEQKVLKDKGDHEVIQDAAGRHLLVFKDRRSGFMPEYLDHPVKNWETWEQNVKWRLNPTDTERFMDLRKNVKEAQMLATQGMMITQNLIGGFMYLRSLMGIESLLFAFHDEPKLIHDCMQTWLELSDKIIAYHQNYVTLDELFFGEDVCYNHGPLIGPDMIKEFLFPYYQQLITNVKARRIGKSVKLFVHFDTDGFAIPVIKLYQDYVGMNAMSPFEVASGCDVVEIGRGFPDLIISGGIDKRVLAEGKAAIDKHLEYIIPAMKARGGYTPTCDHGVPAEVSLENYLYYRKRCVELGS
jgi:hypothetical protein